MSSFAKNIIPRREHRERAQPESRVAKHGLLEKKKDYKIRAKHRNKKKLRLKLLKEKAAFRNPDEFYYGMINSRTTAGRVNSTLDPHNGIPLANRTREQRLLAETQDKAYVGVKSSLENGRVESLQKGLHFVAAAAAAPRRHVVFVDDEEQLETFGTQDAQEGTVAADGGEGVGNDVVESVPLNARSRKELRKERKRAYKEFEQRVDRHHKLKTVLHDIELEKKLLDKGRRLLVRAANKETGEPALYKWRQERKR